jgi:hypothetical protein
MSKKMLRTYISYLKHDVCNHHLKSYSVNACSKHVLKIEPVADQETRQFQHGEIRE